MNFHALVCAKLFSGKTYKEIVATRGKEPDLYQHGKNMMFLYLYGGGCATLRKREESLNMTTEKFLTKMKRTNCVAKEIRDASELRIAYKTKAGWKRLRNPRFGNSQPAKEVLRDMAFATLEGRMNVLFRGLIAFLMIN